MGDSVPKYAAASGAPPYMSAPGVGYAPVQYGAAGGEPAVAPPQQQQMQYVQGPVQQGMTAEEVAIAKLDNSIATMEEQQMTGDPRYAHMLLLKQKISGSSFAVGKLA